MNKAIISYFNINRGVSYNSIIQTYQSNLSSRGFTEPSSATLSAMNTLTDSIGSTIWGLIDVFYVMSLNNASLTDTYRVNLKTPASNLITSNGAISYGLAGPQGDGVSAFLDTNFNPSTAGGNYALNSASRLLWVYTDDAGAPTVMDGTSNASFNIISSNNGTSHRINAGASGVLNSAVDMVGTGYKAINRSTSTDVQLYKVLTKSDRTQTSSSIFNGNQYIFRSGTSYSTHRISFYAMGGSLSEVQHNTLQAAMSAYLTALGL